MCKRIRYSVELDIHASVAVILSLETGVLSHAMSTTNKREQTKYSLIIVKVWLIIVII